MLAEEVKNEVSVQWHVFSPSSLTKITASHVQPGYRGSSCDTSPGKPLCREAERENVCMTELIHPEQPGICVLR